MILRISRSQSKTTSGVILFELKAQIDFTKEEADIVNKYKAQADAVVAYESQVLGTLDEHAISFDELVKGRVFRSTSIADIKSTEDALQDLCEILKESLMDMQSFEGGDTYHF